MPNNDVVYFFIYTNKNITKKRNKQFNFFKRYLHTNFVTFSA